MSFLAGPATMQTPGASVDTQRLDVLLPSNPQRDKSVLTDGFANFHERGDVREFGRSVTRHGLLVMGRGRPGTTAAS
jgi:hypothetical protein